jgi:hypothetical protein
MTEKTKKYETIGCCGIDCGLCPKFYTTGDSACPGCGGKNFKEKHPSCGYLTCCAINKGFEVCSQCQEYPCNRFDSEKSGFDSFVTHRKVFTNLDFIKEKGIDQFIKNQKTRINILNELLTCCDDGRSKSFYCISCALLPVAQLEEANKFADSLNSKDIELKEKAKLVKDSLNRTAVTTNICLKLNNKQTKK